MLIYDEVQCGAGRTGKLFAHEWVPEATPDIMAVAKGVGGGFPLGACLATEDVAKGMQVGSHGSTYGGNPLAMAVGNAVWDELTAPGFLENVNRISSALTQSLSSLEERYPDLVEGLRGKGLLRGVALKFDPMRVRRAALDKGLLVGTAGGNVLRLAPPLIITENDIRQAVSIIDECLSDIQKEGV